MISWRGFDESLLLGYNSKEQLSLIRTMSWNECEIVCSTFRLLQSCPPREGVNQIPGTLILVSWIGRPNLGVGQSQLRGKPSWYFMLVTLTYFACGILETEMSQAKLLITKAFMLAFLYSSCNIRCVLLLSYIVDPGRDKENATAISTDILTYFTRSICILIGSGCRTSWSTSGPAKSWLWRSLEDGVELLVI